MNKYFKLHATFHYFLLWYNSIIIPLGRYSGWYVWKHAAEVGQRRELFILERFATWRARGILCEKGEFKRHYKIIQLKSGMSTLWKL